jgi:hypothetical protein
MGADMKVSYVHFPVGHDLEKEKEALILFSESMTQEMMNEIYDEVTYELLVLVDPETAHKEVIKTIELGFETLKSRRTTFITFKESVIYLSGGLSWGDTTEEMKAIEKLGHILHLSRKQNDPYELRQKVIDTEVKYALNNPPEYDELRALYRKYYQDWDKKLLEEIWADIDPKRTRKRKPLEEST